MNRGRFGVLLLASVAFVGCPAKVDVQRGAGGRGTGSTTTSATGATSGSEATSTSNGFDPMKCPDYMSESACAMAGCTWWPATLFPPVNAGPPVCKNGTPLSVCTFVTGSAFQTPGDYRRDVSGGRLVIQTGSVESVPGFELCSASSGLPNPCNCLP